MSNEHDDAILETARKRMKRAYDAWSDNFYLMDDDIDFLAGNQWPEDVKTLRGPDRPMLTINKLPAIIDQVVGDQRQSKQAITVFPAQGDASGETAKVSNIAGTKDYSLAEVYNGILRNIDYTSGSDMAYDTAYEHSAGWGLGYFRIVTEYADDSFDQEFKIKRVRNYKSVLIDPDFEEADASDIEYGFVISKLHEDEFKKKYPKANRTSLRDLHGDVYEHWVDGDYIIIAEYYYLDDHSYTLYQMSDGSVYRSDDVDPVLDELADAGITIVNQRDVSGRKCVWAKITGTDVLETKDTVFDSIPIIPVLGKELVVDGSPVYRGVIRHSKDPQRMYNYHRTADIERTALIPKVPYIIADQQIAGYNNEWNNANKTNKSVLIYKHVDGIPKPHREPPVTGNPGEINASMQDADDIKSTSGKYDASLGARSNETSGKAILARQQEGDVGSYAFYDNLIRAIRSAGRLLIKAIPRIYDTNRIVRLRFPDDSEDFVEINKTIIDEQTGDPVIIHDLAASKFDLVVKSGPSYTTQRMQAAESLTSFVTSIGGGDPVTTKALIMLAAKNMDWPGADEVVEIIKKSLPPDLIDEPDDEEQRPPPQPTPQDMVAMAKVEADMATADAKKAAAEASKAKSQADVAEVLERLNNLENNIKDQVAELIAQTLMELNQGGMIR